MKSLPRVVPSLVLALAAACGGADQDHAAAPAVAAPTEPAAPAAPAEPTEPTAPSVPAAPEVAAGDPSRPVAPDFTLPDLDGKPVSLASFRGKTVVLEWFNPECPFVNYAHGDGPLRDQAKRATAGDVVWLAINSGAPGKQGAGADVNRKAAGGWSMQHPVLLDASGATGKAYGARTTPHMFVIDRDGRIAYRGALDDAPRGRVPAGGAATNYVDAALAALAAGKPPTPAETQAYGCSVKYAD